jgi:hypothetical protein
MTDDDWNTLFSKIKGRYAELVSQSRRDSFLSHVQSLGDWETESYSDIQSEETTAQFPDEIYVAFAICDERCGVQEFIVDGSTQECQRCGRNMFRTEVRKYVLPHETAHVGRGV